MHEQRLIQRKGVAADVQDVCALVTSSALLLVSPWDGCDQGNLEPSCPFARVCCTCLGYAFPRQSNFLWSVVNHVYPLDPICTLFVHKEGQMRSHLDWSTPWHCQVVGPSTALYLVSPQDVARTLQQHDQWVTSAAETVIQDHLAESKEQEGIVMSAGDPSPPAFVREGRAQDGSSSQRPSVQLAQMLLLLGGKAGDPGKTSGLMLYLSESLCGPVGILFF